MIFNYTFAGAHAG